MAEEAEDAKGEGGGTPDTSGLAIDLAMEEARNDPSLHDDVARFLRNQNSLVDIQKHHLHTQFKQLLLGIWEKRIGVALRLATLVVGLAAAGGVGWMVWDAAHSEGLLIEPFTVPAELAARGLNGQAFSSMLLDKLTTLQAQTQSNRPAQSYTNNWGDDLKVEIPETGVSLGEVRRFLREWLGHDTHITGEVWQGAKGLTITARASGGTGEPVTGQESDLDALMQKVALNIYSITQPYRYANYLDRDDYHPGVTDIAAAEAIYRRLVNDPNPAERGFAWNGLANLAWSIKGDDATALDYYDRAAAENPDYGGAYFGTAYLAQSHFSRSEMALKAAREYARTNFGDNRNFWLNELLGDYTSLLPNIISNVRTGRISRANPGVAFQTYGTLHDVAGMRATMRAVPPQPPYQNAVPAELSRLLGDTALPDWQAVLASEPALEKLLQTSYPGWDHKTIFARILHPRLALAKAMTGDTAQAEALIAPAPADCYDCLIIRGQIASEQKQWARADFWFAKAVADAPSIPFAHEGWGRSLLTRGDADAAIAQFTLSNRKGPHFADPLEGWGEALMAKNQSHLAVAKFAAAEKFAPNWGRLHLKWGEALTYAGKAAEARAHFTRAAALDLTPSEKAELARHP